MSAPRSQSVKDRLKEAKLPERSLEVCLRGDLAARFDELERQLREARDSNGPQRMGATSAAMQIVEQQNALRAEMADAMLPIVVRALPRPEWLALTKRHPPREGNDGDQALGTDLSALMEEAIPACVVEPEMDAEDWEMFNAKVSSGDFDKVFTAVWDVNRSGVDLPKSRLSLLVTAESADDSK